MRPVWARLDQGMRPSWPLGVPGRGNETCLGQVGLRGETSLAQGRGFLPASFPKYAKSTKGHYLGQGMAKGMSPFRGMLSHAEPCWAMLRGSGS